jgi:hypothetical protein
MRLGADECDQSESDILATRSTSIQSKHLALPFSVISVFSVVQELLALNKGE